MSLCHLRQLKDYAVSLSFDHSLFAHLRPKQRTDEYVVQLDRFLATCPEDPDPRGAYCQVVRSGRCIDFCDTKHLLSYRTVKDWYRVRTKTRRCEVGYIVFFL